MRTAAVLAIVLASMLAAVAANADGTASLQVIHNAADPDAAVVDVYVNGGPDPFLNDFEFRTATPFVEVPAGVTLTIGVAPGTSTGPGDIIDEFDVVLNEGKKYYAVANGVLSPGSFAPNPDGINIAFSIFPAEAILRAPWPGSVKIKGFHGATDAPTVDILARGRRTRTIIDDLTYGEYSNTRRLKAKSYILDVTPGGDNSVVVASYEADLSGLGGGAALVFASGFLSPGENGDGPAFGLFVALPDGSVLELPAYEPMARLQVIHNAADPGAAVVDIYLNEGASPLIDDFEFRAATPFIDVPADVMLNIGVAPGTSTGPDDIIEDFDVMFEDGETYVAVANGVLSPGSFDPNPEGLDIAFTLFAESGIRESGIGSWVRLTGFHGSTDAPAVDIQIHGPNHIWKLYGDLSYGEFSRYSSVPPLSYQLDVTPAGDSSVVVASFEADLTGLGGGAAVVFASGFLNPAQGEAFGLFAALPDGSVIELPQITTTARLQVIHNAADPSAEVVDIYVNDGATPFLDDFAFRTATPYVDVPAGVTLTIGVAPSTSTGPGDIIDEFDVVLEPNQRYVAIANGVLSPGDFETNPDGRNIGFTLFPRGDMREFVHFGLVRVIAFHGATDAPAVDVIARGLWSDRRLADNMAYGDFSNYSLLLPRTYEVDVTLADDNSVVVASYEAPLGGASGKGVTVFASGFLNPGQGPAFGLFAALPDGTVLELPLLGSRSLDVEGERGAPAKFALEQNSPNPFNPVTSISFSLPEPQRVVMTVYNARGQLIETILNEDRQAGEHTIPFNAEGLASGVYFYRIDAGPNTDMKRMVILK